MGCVHACRPPPGGPPWSRASLPESLTFMPTLTTLRSLVRSRYSPSILAVPPCLSPAHTHQLLPYTLSSPRHPPHPIRAPLRLPLPHTSFTLVSFTLQHPRSFTSFYPSPLAPLLPHCRLPHPRSFTLYLQSSCLLSYTLTPSPSLSFLRTTSLSLPHSRPLPTLFLLVIGTDTQAPAFSPPTPHTTSFIPPPLPSTTPKPSSHCSASTPKGRNNKEKGVGVLCWGKGLVMFVCVTRQWFIGYNLIFGHPSLPPFSAST